MNSKGSCSPSTARDAPFVEASAEFCAICFCEPSNPEVMGIMVKTDLDAENKENISPHATSINPYAGYACLPCCGGSNGQCESTTSTKICTMCVLQLWSREESKAVAVRSILQNVPQGELLHTDHGTWLQSPFLGSTIDAMTSPISVISSPRNPNSAYLPALTIYCPRCRTRLSIQRSSQDSKAQTSDALLITAINVKSTSNCYLRCPTPRLSYDQEDVDEAEHQGEFIHVFRTPFLSPRSQEADIPRNRMFMAPLEAPSDETRDRPHVALSFQRGQLFRFEPNFPSSVSSEASLISADSHTSSHSSINMLEVCDREIVRTISFWE